MNIAIKRGTDKSFKITVKKNGVATDITGWTIYFSVKKQVNDTDANAIIRKVISSHQDAANGITNITIDAEDTREKEVGYFSFDIRVVDDTGRKQSSDTGTFEIIQEITDGDSIS